MVKILFILLQLTWGFLQSLLGFIVFLFNLKSKHHLYKGCIVSYWPRRAGLSLGLFLFIPRVNPQLGERILKHEYGHSIQSMYLGPFYLFYVGIPSLIWNMMTRVNRNKKERYYKFWVEAWADELGKVEEII